MTDEQLERIDRRAEMTLCPENRHTWDGELATGCLALIADYRRLRELERACRGYFHLDSVTGDAYPPTYLRTASEEAALVAIGRLLEGEKPTIEDIGGSDPDFTGGKRTEDYVREMREGGRE